MAIGKHAPPVIATVYFVYYLRGSSSEIGNQTGMFQKGMRCAHQVTLFSDTGTHGLQGFLVTDGQFSQWLVPIDVTSVTGETCVVLVQKGPLSNRSDAFYFIRGGEKTRTKERWIVLKS